MFYLKIVLFMAASLLWQAAICVEALYGKKKVWAVFLPIFLLALSLSVSIPLIALIRTALKEIIILYIVNWSIGIAITAIFAMRKIRRKRKEGGSN